MNNQEKIIEEIKQERIIQDDKFGEQNWSPIEWIAILAEEVGEAAKEANDYRWNPQKFNRSNYRNELIQVAAVALSMVECLDRNKPCPRCEVNPQQEGGRACNDCIEEMAHDEERAQRGEG
jgi:NTP pyrophosphatase (non-canonical NTP hydrolase)